MLKYYSQGSRDGSFFSKNGVKESKLCCSEIVCHISIPVEHHPHHPSWYSPASFSLICILFITTKACLLLYFILFYSKWIVPRGGVRCQLWLSELRKRDAPNQILQKQSLSFRDRSETSLIVTRIIQFLYFWVHLICESLSDCEKCYKFHYL